MPKPRPVLCEMPWLVKQKVIGHTDNISRLRLRKTNTEFCQLVDDSPHPTHYKLIQFFIKRQRARLIYVNDDDQEFRVEYHKATFGCRTKYQDRFKDVIGNFDYIQKAVLDLATIFAHQEALVGELCLKTTHHVINSVRRWPESFPKDKVTFLNTFQQAFSQFPHLAQIKKFRIEWALNEAETMQIIPFLKPTYLKELELNLTKDDTFENVWRTEQYQNLVEMLVVGEELTPYLTAKICAMTTCFDMSATSADLAALLERLLLQNPEEFKDFVLKIVTYSKTDFLNHLVNVYHLDPQETNQHVMMMDSHNYLVISLQTDLVAFTRVDQELGLALLRGAVLDLTNR